ncbi:hypothetical protein H6G27_24005 [Nostoc linckia FACHB-104]|nr:hypothetical protein [Nostoc linckia FACHB-104]
MEAKLSNEVSKLFEHDQNTYQSIVKSADQIHKLINQEYIDKKRALELLDQLRAVLDTILDSIEVYQENFVTVSSVEKKDKEEHYHLLVAQLDEFVDILQNDFENLLLSGNFTLELRFQEKLVNQLKNINTKLDDFRIKPEKLYSQVKLLRDTVYTFRKHLLDLNDIDFAKNHFQNKNIFVNIILGLFGISLFTTGGCMAALEHVEKTSETKEVPITMVVDKNPSSEPNPVVQPSNELFQKQKYLINKPRPSISTTPVITSLVQAVGIAVIGRAVNNLGKDTHDD